MSVIKAVDTLNPYAKSDKVLNIILDSQSDAYSLSNLIHEAGTYVFAIWVKTDANSTVKFKILGTDVSFEATDSWQLFTKRIDADSSNKSVEIKPQININSYFYEGFLSKGTTFTGWSPAPEDVDEDINNAQSSADKANTNASNAQQSANSAQNTANNASTKADQVKADVAAASLAAQKAKDQADKAQKDSDAAKALATNAWNDINDLEQVVIVDSSGVRVLESKNSKNYSHIKSDGMHVFNNGNDVAQFGQQSKMNNLAVKDYMMFGAHRAELSTINEEQGTAFYWIGDIQ